MPLRQIQSLDGLENTEPNARGCVPYILEAARFDAVEKARVIATPTGLISIYRAQR